MALLDFNNAEQTAEYEEFIQKHRLGGFTQSLNWCKVKNGWEREAVIVRGADGKITGSALVLIKRAPLLGKSFFYSPRGPICDFEDKETLSALAEGIKALARKKRAYIFKCDPLILLTEDGKIKAMADAGFILQPDPEETSVQCRCNYMLDLAGRSAEEIFANLHAKWRYNVRLAERKGVVCEHYSDGDWDITDKVSEFYALMRETGARDGFLIRSEKYFLSLLKNFGESCRLYLCYYDGKAVSGAVSVSFAGKTCYVYGASSSCGRESMPNHLMQWTMIKWAIERGDYIYDFQGIPHYKDENHPNYGVYRFKNGFSGYAVEYAGEFDMVFSPFIAALVKLLYKSDKKMHHIKLRGGFDGRGKRKSTKKTE